MNRDCFICGVFCGALVCCWFMWVFPVPKVCEVRVGKAVQGMQVTQVFVGQYKE